MRRTSALLRCSQSARTADPGARRVTGRSHPWISECQGRGIAVGAEGIGLGNLARQQGVILIAVHDVFSRPGSSRARARGLSPALTTPETTPRPHGHGFHDLNGQDDTHG